MRDQALSKLDSLRIPDLHLFKSLIDGNNMFYFCDLSSHIQASKPGLNWHGDLIGHIPDQYRSGRSLYAYASKSDDSDALLEEVKRNVKLSAVITSLETEEFIINHRYCLPWFLSPSSLSLAIEEGSEHLLADIMADVRVLFVQLSHDSWIAYSNDSDELHRIEFNLLRPD